MNVQTTDKRRRTAKKVFRAGAMLFGLLCFIVLLLVLRFHTKQVSVKAGDTFPRDIAAPFTGTDPFLTDKERQKVREKAPVVYETAPELVAKHEGDIENWFSGLEAWFGDMEAIWAQNAETLEGKYLFRGSNVNWKELVPEDKMVQALARRGLSGEVTVTVAYLILDQYLPANKVHLIGEAVTADDFKKAVSDTIYPLLEEGIEEKDLSAKQTAAKNSIRKKSLISALKTEVADKLIERFLLPTLAVNAAATEENRRLAASTVADVHITRGEVLFQKGALVKAEDITHLTALGLLNGTGSRPDFSFAALFFYATLCVLAVGLWLILFEKRLLMRTGAMCALTANYALAVLFAFGCSYVKSSVAPVLFAVLIASEEGKKEHTAGALLFSVMALPVLLDADMPFGAESFSFGASLLIGGLCVCAFCHFPKTGKKEFLPCAVLGGLVIGFARVCPMLWEHASGFGIVREFGFSFLGGVLAAVLAFFFRPFHKKLRALDDK